VRETSDGTTHTKIVRLTDAQAHSQDDGAQPMERRSRGILRTRMLASTGPFEAHRQQLVALFPFQDSGFALLFALKSLR
jgi:hypothetical protein